MLSEVFPVRLGRKETFILQLINFRFTAVFIIINEDKRSYAVNYQTFAGAARSEQRRY